jgi:hypothetical protein
MEPAATVSEARVATTAIPERTKFPFGCGGYVAAVAVGQRQRFYSGVGMKAGAP